MRVEIIYHENDTKVLLFINQENIVALLGEWGIKKSVLKNLVLTLEVWRDLCSDGKYCGSRDGRHRILIPYKILLGNCLYLNQVVIHELRHMFWNIVAPGKHVTEEGFKLRCGEGCLVCDDDKRARDEQNDCFVCEKKYENFNVAKTINRNNLDKRSLMI